MGLINNPSAQYLRVMATMVYGGEEPESAIVPGCDGVSTGVQIADHHSIVCCRPTENYHDPEEHYCGAAEDLLEIGAVDHIVGTPVRNVYSWHSHC